MITARHGIESPWLTMFVVQYQVMVGQTWLMVQGVF